MKKKNQNKTKITDNIYNSRNRNQMEMENVRFNYDDHLADYMKRNGRAGKDRVKAMNNSIAMDESHQESKITATSTIRKSAHKTNPSITDELTDSVKRGVNKTFDKFIPAAGTYLGGKFAKWSYGKLLAAGAATTALTVGMYSGYKKLEDEE